VKRSLWYLYWHHRRLFMQHNVIPYLFFQKVHLWGVRKKSFHCYRRMTKPTLRLNQMNHWSCRKRIWC